MQLLKHWRPIPFLLCLILFPFSISHADWIEDYFKSKHPEVLDTINSQYPLLSGWITQIILKMEEVVNQSLPEGVPKKKLKHLFMYQSSKREGSPAVIRRKEESEYAVMINSDFLKRILRSSTNDTLEQTQREEVFKENLLNLTGVIAHEMGHVIIEGAIHGPRDQDAEATADKMGIMLLRKVGLPREGIVKTMDFLKEEFPNPNESKEGKIFSEGVSSHPQGEVRKSGARINTVLDSFQIGAYPRIEFPDLAPMMRELNGIPENKSIPATFDEAASKVEKTLNEMPAIQAKIRKELESLKYEQSLGRFPGVRLQMFISIFQSKFQDYCKVLDLASDFDWMIVRLKEQEEKGISEDVRDRFFTLAQRHFTWEETLHRDKRDDELLTTMAAEFCDNQHAPAEVPQEKLVQAIESSAILQESKYLDLVLPPPPTSSPPEQKYLEMLWRSQRYVPRNKYAEFKLNHFFPNRLELLERNPVSERSDFLILGRPLPTEKGGATFPDFELTRLKTMAELGHRISDSKSPINIINGLEEAKKGNSLLSLINFKGIDPENPQWMKLSEGDQDKIKKLANFVWVNAAQLGLMEIHWQNIGALLKIDPSTIKKDLRSAVLSELGKAEPPKVLLRSVDGPRTWAPQSSYSFKDKFQELDEEGWENSSDLWGGQPVLEALLKKKSMSLGMQRRVLPHAFSENTAQSIANEWMAKSGDPHQVGKYVRSHELIQEPLLTASNIVPGSDEALEFQASHSEYPIWKEIVRWLDESKMPKDDKRKALLSLIETPPSQERKVPLSKDLDFVLPILKKYQVFESPAQVFEWVNGFGKDRWKRKEESRELHRPDTALCKHQRAFLSFIDSEVNLVLQHLVDNASSTKIVPDQLMEKARFYLDPELPLSPPIRLSEDKGPRGTSRCISSEFNLRKSKKILVDWLLTQKEAPEQILRHIDLLTLTGSTPDTDRYLREKLSFLSEDKRFPDWRTRWLSAKPKIETQHRDDKAPQKSDFINGQRFLSEMVRSELDHRFKVAKENSGALFDASRDFITHQFPKKTRERDQLLEELVWKFPEMKASEIRAKVTPLKTESRDGRDYPYYLNLISALGSFIEEESLPHKAEWVKYIKNPSPTNKAAVFDQMRSWKIDNSLWDSVGKEQWMEALHQQMTDTLADERLPFLEFLLGGVSAKTPVPLYLSSEVFDPLLEELTNLRAGSPQKRILAAYLRSCAPHERSPILAYFLAHQGEEEGGVRPLFEVFSSVGIKTGQLASILNVFDDPTTQKDLSVLKDNAQPLEKGKVLEILEKSLGKETFGHIKGIHKILGSASIKTVVEVEWDTGERSAVMIRRPNAKQLIEENLERTIRFMKELNSDPELRKKAAAIDPLRKIVAEELHEEVEFEKEIENTKKAGSLYGTSKVPKPASEQKGWTIQVPQVHPELSRVYEESKEDPTASTVMVMEMARGVPFHKLKVPIQQQIGKVIVSELIDQLFSKGFMNADPHTGNFLIDEEKRTIHPIDFGQAESLNPKSSTREDERYQLAHFLAALDSKDASKLFDYGQQFCSSTPPLQIQQQIREKLRSLLEIRKLDITGIINTFNESGAPFSRRFFGILKGLAILQNEGYVSEADFQSLVASAVKRTIKGTSGGIARYVMDRIGQKRDQWSESLSSYFGASTPKTQSQENCGPTDPFEEETKQQSSTKSVVSRVDPTEDQKGKNQIFDCGQFKQKGKEITVNQEVLRTLEKSRETYGFHDAFDVDLEGILSQRPGTYIVFPKVTSNPSQFVLYILMKDSKNGVCNEALGVRTVEELACKLKQLKDKGWIGQGFVGQQ